MLSKKKKKNRLKVQEGDPEIVIDKDSDHPSTAWKRLRDFHFVQPLPTNMYLRTPQEENSLRFVCLSDTHGVIEDQRKEFYKLIPDGDVLIHCGDFSMFGDPSEIIRFDSFMARLPYPVKIVIAGNHDLTFEKNNFSTDPNSVRQKLGLSINAPEEDVVAGCKGLLEHLLYLEDEAITICGIKLYGSPWVPQCGAWGFGLRRGQSLLEMWNRIPSDTDILVTHSPPCGYGDTVSGNKQAGCVELLNTVVQRVKPKFHVFGHIHSGYGMWTNRKTTFINSSVCNNHCKLINDPIVFDLPIPKGYSREDFARLSTEKLRQARKHSQNVDSRLSEEGAACGAASLDEAAADSSSSVHINGDDASRVNESAFVQHQPVQAECQEDVESEVAALHL